MVSPEHRFRGGSVLHFFKRWRKRPPATATREGLFALGPEPRVRLTAATVLAAHLAVCDDEVNDEETAAFERLFRFPSTEREHYAQLFAQNCRHTDLIQPFIAQLVHVWGRGSAALEVLVERLYHLAAADGALTTAESTFLDELCDAFGVPGYWRQVDALRPHDDDPYRVLGVLRDASDEEVRAAFQRLTRLHHPDAIVARGAAHANDAAMATINRAYRQVMRQRRSHS